MGNQLLPVSDLPNVDFPTIQVSAQLPGASPVIHVMPTAAVTDAYPDVTVRITGAGEAGEDVISGPREEPGGAPTARLALPIAKGGRELGTLHVRHHTALEFGEEDRRTFALLADRLAVALENAALVAQMRAFWDNTPFSNFGLYIGGADLGCPTPDAAYVRQVQAMGWRFMPIWVGPQAPCSIFIQTGNAPGAKRSGWRAMRR